MNPLRKSKHNYLLFVDWGIVHFSLYRSVVQFLHIFASIAYLSLNEMHTKGTNQINFWKQFLDRSYLMAIGKEEIKVVSNLGLVSVWPDLAKFRHFGKLLTAYFLFGKKLNLLWQIYYITGQFIIAANGQILKHNLIIWSHW